MTVEWIDAPGEWYNDVRGIYHEVSSAVGAPTTVDGRRCLAMPPAGFIRHYTASGQTDFVIHAGVQFLSSSGNLQVFRALDGAAHHIYIERIQSTGLLRVVHGGGTVLATGATATSTGVWYWLSFGAHIADVGGTYELKINGTTEVSSGSADTRNGSSGTATKLQIGNENAGVTGTPNFYCRDIVMLVGTTTHLSQRRVCYLQPNRAGNSTQWTPSAGSNYQNVDERDGAPDDNTTYNSETTNGDIDLYALAPFPSSALTVDAVTEVARLSKTTNTKQLSKRVLRTNSTNYESGDIGLALGYKWTMSDPRETNPNTSAAWDEAEINRLQMGVKKAS